MDSCGYLDRLSPPKRPPELSNLVFGAPWGLIFLDFDLPAHDVELRKLDFLSFLPSSPLNFL